MPINTLLAIQEMLLNRVLRLDPETVGGLRQLSGKVAKLEFDHASYYCIFTSTAVCLSKDYDGLVDLVLGGSIFDFIRMGLFKNGMASTTIPIQISGDMEFARQFRDFFANVEIDWEEQLSQVVGDGVAYPLAQCLRLMKQWAKRSVESISQNVKDYLQAETDLLVSKEELQIFFSDIDGLRDEVARLQARIARLQRK